MLPFRQPALEGIISYASDYGVDLTELKSVSQQRHLTEVRAMIAWLAKIMGGITLTETDACLNRDVGTMSSAHCRLE